MKLKKGIPVIDQGDKFGFWGGKFGGNFVPETLKKPIEDLEIQFNKVFWHDTRITHGLLYLVSVYYIYIGNIEMNSLILALDIIFSIVYRFYFKK